MGDSETEETEETELGVEHPAEMLDTGSGSLAHNGGPEGD
jgi:hypothetical protein